MKTVDITKFKDSLVLHFDIQGKSINAYTLASTLVSLADAAKAANDALNVGYDVEVLVEAIGEGSFRTQIRTVYRKTKNLFSDQRVQAVALSIIAAYIYERTFAIDDRVSVQVNTDEVVISRDDERIIVPRDVYDATRVAERNPKFVRSIERAVSAVERDDKIAGLGFVRVMESPVPDVLVLREMMAKINEDTRPLEPVRVVSEIADLRIFKAILDKSKRKWEFYWRGFKISAPVIDDEFYGQFFSHSITIAPGDLLRATLEIEQQLDVDTGIYSNKSYTVSQVLGHEPRISQGSIDEVV